MVFVVFLIADFDVAVQFGDPPLRVVLNLLSYTTYADAATFQVCSFVTDGLWVPFLAVIFINFRW
jgi:hypothetical protein